MSGARFHPLYRDLHAELHARPFPVVSGPAMVGYRAVLRTPAVDAAFARHLAALATAWQVALPSPEHGFQLLLGPGGCDVRIERHHEFISVLAIVPGDGAPFAWRAADRLPAGWFDGLPGEAIAAVELCVLRCVVAETMERVGQVFGNERLVGGWAVERTAQVWSTFRLDAAGHSRYLVIDLSLTPGRLGRLLQRLVEIETYRLQALRGLPVARSWLPLIEELERLHAAQAERLAAPDRPGDEDERALLAGITGLAVACERLLSQGEGRLSATAAYARILNDRVRELREEQVPGYQTIGEFFERRMAPAVYTCSDALLRLRELGARIHATTALLRTRVDVNLQSQNQRLLASVDRRSAAQLRLQHAVEGLSVVVLTYYLVGLLKYVLEGAKSLGWHPDSALVVALAVPLIGLGLWWSVLRLHQRHLR
jgi:uncharacterized membrane-anchored protein